MVTLLDAKCSEVIPYTSHSTSKDVWTHEMLIGSLDVFPVALGLSLFTLLDKGGGTPDWPVEPGVATRSGDARASHSCAEGPNFRTRQFHMICSHWAQNYLQDGPA